MILKSLIGQITLGVGTASLTVTTLVAFNIVPLDLPEYKIVTVVGNGQPTLTFTSEPGNPIIVPEPSVDGYFFLGWYTDTTFSTLFKERKMPRSDLFLYAGWRKLDLTEPPVISIRDDLDLVVYEGIIGEDIRINPKEKEGLVFDNFYQDFETTKLFTKDKLDTPVENIYIRYVPDYKPIVYFLNGGTLSLNSPTQYVFASDSSQYQLNTPTRVGHTFKGWFSNPAFDGDRIENFDTRKQQISLYAKWEIRQYQLRFFGFNDSLLRSFDLNYNHVISDDLIPSTLPVVEGYLFLNWSEQIPSNMPDYDLDIKAIYDNEVFNIEFLDFSGNSIINYNYKFNESLASLEIPVVEVISGLTFVGWLPSVPARMPARNLVLKAVYLSNTNTTPIYNVVFNLNNGLNPIVNSVLSGLSVSAIQQPTRLGYTFVNWYTDQSLNNVYDFFLPVTSNLELYAKWEQVIEGATITFFANGADDPSSVNMATQFVDQGSPTPLNINTFVRVGHTFRGWSTSQITPINYNSSLIAYSNQANITLNSPTISLFALWQANQYQVTINANGGTTPSLSTITVTYGQPYGTLPTTTKVGYSLDNWRQSNSVSGSIINSSSNVNIANNHTIYAQWTPLPITVSFDSKVSGVNPASKNVSYDSTYGDLPDLTNSRSGYTFNGWFTLASGGSQIISSSTVTVTNNITLHAQWSAKTFTVTFDKQGGAGGTNSVTATYDTAMPAATAPSRDGYTFAGYYSGTNGSGTQYYSSAMSSLINYTIDGTTTLYARWTANTYTVTFDSNGGSTPDPLSKTVTFGSPYGVLPTVTKAGYNFSSWYINIAGTDFDINSSTTVSLFQNHTIFARWSSQNSYNIIFNASDSDGGSMNNLSFEYTSGTIQVNLTANGYSKTGFNFAGWATASNGSVVYSDSQQISISQSGDINLYAKWTPKTYTLTFDKNAGSGGTNSVSVTFGSPMPSATAPTRTGYIFSGYTQNLNGTGTQYYNSSMTSTSNWNQDVADPVIYAQWSAKTFTVTFDKQGGAGGTNSVTATYDTAMPAATAPSRDGYTFAGYYSGTNGSGTQYYSSAMSSLINYTIDGTTTLYARWTANTYTVTFDKQLGTGGSDSTPVTFGSAMPSGLIAPTKSSSIFGGYYSSIDGGGTKYYDSSMVSTSNYNIVGNATLFAYWTTSETIYTIEYYVQDTESSEYYLYSSQEESSTVNATGTADPIIITGSDYSGTTASTAQSMSYPLSATESTYTVQYTSLYTLLSTPVAYTVTFDKQSGSGGTNNVTAYNGSAMPVATAPTRASHAFLGYFDATSGGNKYYDSSMNSTRNFDKTEATTLYARWTDSISADRTITLDRNYTVQGGGTYNPPTITVKTGEFLPTLNSTQNPLRAGFKFIGFFTTNATSGGEKYFNEDSTGTRTYDLVGNITVYARWIANPTATVKPDGETIIRLYYNRRPVTVAFNSENNSEELKVERIRFGGSSTPPSVTSPGKKLLGWSGGGYNNVVNLRGTSNTAVLVEEIFEIKYFLNSGTNNPSNPNTFTGLDSIITLTNPSRSGYTFDAWNENSNFSGSAITQINPSNESERKNYNLYAKWTIISYNLTYSTPDPTKGYINGNTNQTVNAGSSGSQVSAVAQPGYYFFQWSDGNTNPIRRELNVNSALSFVATFGSTPYTISFNVDGGNQLSNLIYEVGTNVTSLPTPIKTNFTFGGWKYSDNTSVILPFNMPANDLTLVASWIENPFTITYVLGDSSLSNPNITTYNSTTVYTFLNPSNRVGYNFMGWFTEAEFTNQITSITSGSDGNLSLHAKWELITYTITYNTDSLFGSINPNDGTVTNDTKSVQYNVTSATYSYKNPEDRSGFIFVGWFDSLSGGNQITVRNQGSIGNLTLYARWQDANTSTISFETNGAASISPISGVVGSSFSAPNNPTRNGHIFDGWYTNPNLSMSSFYVFEEDPIIPVISFTLYAKWSLINYTITYDLTALAGATTVNPRTYNIESQIYLSEPSPRLGFEFNGWYDNANYDGSIITIINIGSFGNKTFFAKWIIPEYDLILINGGNTLHNVKVALNARIDSSTLGPLPKLLDSQNSRFVGWNNQSNGLGIMYSGSELMPIGGLTLYAVFSSDIYIIEYEPNGGLNNPNNPKSYTYISGNSNVVLTILAASRAGYTFSGWYTDAELATILASSVVNTNTAKDYKLYAKWTPIIYNISYVNTLDSVNNNPINYNVLSSNINLSSLSSSGSIFDGWYLDQNYNESISVIPTGSIGNITLYAKWITEFRNLTTFVVNTSIVTQDFSSGLEFSVMLSNDNQVYTWGNNKFGQLGNGTFINSNIPINITSRFNLTGDDYIKYLYTGANHTIALSNLGQIFAWGQNTLGQIGDGTANNRNLPVNITSRFNLENNEVIEKVYTGFNNTWVQTSRTVTISSIQRKRILGWGNNGFYQIGDGTNITRLNPVDITAYLYSYVDKVYTFKSGNSTSPSLDNGGAIIKIQGGDGFSVLLTDNKRVMTWGRNDSNSKLLGYNGGNTPVLFYLNQRYDPRFSNSKNILTSATPKSNPPTEWFIDINVGAKTTYMVTNFKNIFVFGDNLYGQFGNNTTSNANPYKLPVGTLAEGSSYSSAETIGMINNKFNHTIIIIKNTSAADRLFIFGSNNFSQSGTNVGTSSNPTNVSMLNVASEFISGAERIRGVALGLGHTGIFTTTGNSYAFGLNTSGQLGIGNFDNRIVNASTDLRNTKLSAGSFTQLLNTYTFAINQNIAASVETPSNFVSWHTINDLDVSSIYTISTMPAENLTLFAKRS